MADIQQEKKIQYQSTSTFLWNLRFKNLYIPMKTKKNPILAYAVKSDDGETSWSNPIENQKPIVVGPLTR